jgi:hypothetical protein
MADKLIATRAAAFRTVGFPSPAVLTSQKLMKTVSNKM